MPRKYSNIGCVLYIGANTAGAMSLITFHLCFQNSTYIHHISIPSQEAQLIENGKLKWQNTQQRHSPRPRPNNLQHF
jgi:hypothetical protein